MNNKGIIKSFYVKNNEVKAAISLDNKVEIDEVKYNVYILQCKKAEIFKEDEYLDCDDTIKSYLTNLLDKKLDFELDTIKTPFKIVKITYNHDWQK